MLKTLKILMVLTSHATLGDTGQATGVWFEELATPYYAFIDAGVEVDLASVNGDPIPIDPHSQAPEGQNQASVERFLKDKAAMAKLQASTVVDKVTDANYAAIFLPGGHGTMWDLPNSTALAALLSNAWTHGKVMAAVCHGPAGLVSVKDADGKPLVAGKRVSAFTNAEEEAAGKTDLVPFLLETRIRDLGAQYESGPNFEPFAVRDGNLVTGQNPASSEKVAELTLEAVKASVE